METQTRLMTAEEFAALPEDGKLHDLVQGVLIEVSRPKPIHGVIQRRVGGRIGDFVDAQELGTVTTESGYWLTRDPDTVRGPDVAFISKMRLPKPDLTEFIPMAPDLAVEIVSPGDSATEVVDKVEEYFRAGTRLVWVIYPSRKQAYVYSSPSSVKIKTLDETLDGEEVLPGFSLSLRDIFKNLGE